ncbi:MAG: glycosyltransferase, partial [Verrucomicrobiota bacterium]
PQRRTVLFLGRLHPVKGVARLVEAWAEIQIKKAESIPLKSRNWESRKQKSEDRGPWSVVRGPVVRGPWSGDWQLVIAGPDEGGMRPGLEAALRAQGCEESVIFTGELDEQQKWAAYRAADLFVMPSDFENFGNSIVEAMLSSLPVITTTGTPWKELPAQGAGWCVEPTVEAVRDALGAAMAMPDDARQEMGRRAAVLAAKFGPEQVGADLIQVYEWMLGRRDKPECVC